MSHMYNDDFLRAEVRYREDRAQGTAQGAGEGRTVWQRIEHRNDGWVRRATRRAARRRAS